METLYFNIHQLVLVAPEHVEFLKKNIDASLLYLEEFSQKIANILSQRGEG